ncbi:MAG TPA: hypothetical protein PK569_21015, partial [Thermoanaerobaculia bacterium]|nr:hypothetical protein [Thermoanaerobaculia bacterium]
MGDHRAGAAAVVDAEGRSVRSAGAGASAGAKAAPSADRTDLLRRITGIRGRVAFAQELRLRFDYARALPW